MRGTIALVVGLLGCSSPGPAPADAAPSDAGTDADLPCTASSDPSRLVVTADWMARSLSLLSLDRAIDPGCDAEETLAGTIDLAAWAPGPIEVEVTPDGRTALVAIGPGFFDGTGSALVGGADPEQEHALLLVDLESRSVVAELPTRDAPMGLAIAPDGARAYAAGFGHSAARGSTLIVVDLAARSVLDEIEVGGLPEQVVLSEDGALGALSLDGTSTVRVFRTADVAGSLSPELAVGRDPSDLAFVPGTDRLIVATSITTGYAVVDVSDPSAPTLASMHTLRGGIPYGAAWIPGTTEVLITTSLREELVRVDAAAPEAPPSSRIPLAAGGFLLGPAITPEGTHALVAHPRSHVLSVVELATGDVIERAWTDAPGPTWVALAIR